MARKRRSYKYKATMIRGQGGATAVPRLFYFVLLNGRMRWWKRSVFSRFVGDFFKTGHSVWEKHVWPLQPLTKCQHSRLGSPLWGPIMTTFIHNFYFFYFYLFDAANSSINVLIKVDCGADKSNFKCISIPDMRSGFGSFFIGWVQEAAVVREPFAVLVYLMRGSVWWSF